MITDEPKCRYCKLPMGGYDADRGYSCVNRNCMSNIEEDAYFENYCRGGNLHSEIVAKLASYPAASLTIEELGWIFSKQPSRDGFKLRATLRRLERAR